MSMILLADFIELCGELCLAFTVLSVHRGVMIERKIDTAVLLQMKKEQFVGLIGGALLIASFFIRMTI